MNNQDALGDEPRSPREPCIAYNDYGCGCHWCHDCGCEEKEHAASRLRAEDAPVEAKPTSSPNRKVCPTCGESGLGCDQFGCWNVPTSSPLGNEMPIYLAAYLQSINKAQAKEVWEWADGNSDAILQIIEIVGAKATDPTPVSPLGRQDACQTAELLLTPEVSL